MYVVEKKIKNLYYIKNNLKINISREINYLNRKIYILVQNIYNKITSYQTILVSRNYQRPNTKEYIKNIFKNFHELCGDRFNSEDKSIIGGLANFKDKSCIVIGHQKGKNLNEKIERNFGMPKPEGYRKTLRLVKLAEKFNLPIITFIDTPGAYPGIDAEKKNQSESIGKNIYILSKLSVPILAIIIGEGGSGGALAIAVPDILVMLRYSTYSVISPEGCASILWRDNKKIEEAAKQLLVKSSDIKNLGFLEYIIDEPIGGANRDNNSMYDLLYNAILYSLNNLLIINKKNIINTRIKKLLYYGKFLNY